MASSSAAPSQPRERIRNPYSSLPNWLYPTWVVVVLTLFLLYGFWVVFQTRAAAWGPYLSPFNSPLIQPFPWLPPAIVIAWIPAVFRLTCYYYRKAYFRSYFNHPRSCAVSEHEDRGYRGETAFPWVLNNLHRYAFYITALQVVVLWYDAVKAFDFGGHFGLGLGTVLMAINVVLLSGYTFGCHAFRHLSGGGMDCFSCSKARHTLWRGVTVLNMKHDRWAWASLFSVLLVDIYIRLLAHGAFVDPRFF